MDRERQTDLGSFASIFKEFLTVHIQDAAVVCLFLANIRLEHCRRVRTERSIHEHFNGADPQPVIPEARTQPKLVYLIEQLHRNILEHTQLELSFFMKL